MTGQATDDSDGDAGVAIATDLVNALAINCALGRPIVADDDAATVQRILERDSTWPALHASDVAGMRALAMRLRDVFNAVRGSDIDSAAGVLNELLARHPAHPHLAKDHGSWRLHHHPADAALVPMATAICAEALARTIGSGSADRMKVCEAQACDRVFVDSTKNGSRRFCTTACQNRVKAAAFRRRRAEST